MDVITNTLGLTATLRWTAPLDAVTYTLRSSDVYLTEANWNDAVVIPVPFNASVPSSIEQLSTRLDYPEDAVYLALKSQNNKGNWSELSNIAFWPHQEVYLPLIIKQ